MTSQTLSVFPIIEAELPARLFDRYAFQAEKIRRYAWRIVRLRGLVVDPAAEEALGAVRGATLNSHSENIVQVVLFSPALEKSGIHINFTRRKPLYEQHQHLIHLERHPQDPLQTMTFSSDLFQIHNPECDANVPGREYVPTQNEKGQVLIKSPSDGSASDSEDIWVGVQGANIAVFVSDIPE